MITINFHNLSSRDDVGRLVNPLTALATVQGTVARDEFCDKVLSLSHITRLGGLSTTILYRNGVAVVKLDPVGGSLGLVMRGRTRMDVADSTAFQGFRVAYITQHNIRPSIIATVYIKHKCVCVCVCLYIL